MDTKKKLAYLTLFTGTVLGSICVVNKLYNYIATSNHLIDENSYHYYEWRFGRISYKKKGSGSPLLLVHDFNVYSSSKEWNNVIDNLSKTNTVYAIDLLGCGCSDRPSLTYTNYLYVQLITDFIKNIIKEKTDVIVSGDSCPFVVMACANDNTIIDKVVMVNPPELTSLSKIPTKRSKLLKHLLFLPIIGTFLYNMRWTKKEISEVFISSLYYDPNKVSGSDLLASLECCHRDHGNSKYLYASIVSHYTNINILFALKKLNNSIFILTGKEDPDASLTAIQYQSALPSIEICEIEKSKKLPHMENGNEFVEQASIFLSDLM